MALLFTCLLGIASATLGYFMYAYGQGRHLSEAEVAISSSNYKLIMVLGIISIIMMSLVVAISFIISTFVVSRINIIGLTAKRIIETGDLSRRIAIDSKWDDLSNLAYVLNALIERIETSMEDVRQVSDNIAHDLRTPLARLINKLEDIRKNPTIKNDVNANENVENILHEADRMLQTFNALLRISNINKAKRHTKFESVQLHQLVSDVIELYEPLAEEKQIKLNVNVDNINYNGDRNLLFQAVANLIDNAIKFTNNNGTIDIFLQKNGDKVNLIIADNGIGISDTDKEKVFTRFYRSESSRTSPGNGLGLTLVSEVIKHHKGNIVLKDNDPGLKLIIEL